MCTSFDWDAVGKNVDALCIKPLSRAMIVTRLALNMKSLLSAMILNNFVIIIHFKHAIIIVPTYIDA